MNAPDLLDNDLLKELIGEWLEYAGDSRPVVGLEREEALRRGGELLPEIVAGKIEPSSIVLDEEFKDVLYALVGLAQTGERDGATERARAVYEFIRGVEWPNDALGEKGELLAQCLAASRSKPDEDAGSSTTEARTLFEAGLALIHASLIDRHGLSEIEAREIEQDLLDWFVRFYRRSVGTVANVQALLLETSDRFVHEKRCFPSACSEIAPSARVLELNRSRPARRGRNKGAG